MSRRVFTSCIVATSLFCAALPAQAQFALTNAGLPVRPAETPSPLQSIVFPKPQPPVTKAANEPQQATPAAEQDDPAVAQAIGCLIAGTAGTTVALAAGSENVVNIVAGGLVVPVNRVALYTAVVGVVFGTFCAVGQAMTPLYLHVAKKGLTNVANVENDKTSTKQHPAAGTALPQDDFTIRRASMMQPTSEVSQQEADFATPASFLRKR